MGGVFSYFTRHRTAANLLLLLLVVAGLWSAPRMRAQFFPDIVSPTLSVGLIWTGAGAQDIDTGIVQIVEPALLAVEGVVASHALSREGRADIALDFEPDWNMGQASEDVQAALDTLTGLPAGAEEPTVRLGGWRDHVTDVVISGPIGVQQLAGFADELSARLFQRGVSRVSVQGLAAPRTIVEVPQRALIAHNVSMAEIAAALAAEVDTAPAGEVASGAARVRTGVEKREVADLEAIVLRSTSDGAPLTIGDVARLRVEGVARLRSYFVGAQPAMVVRVERSARGDAIAIQRSVENVAQEMRAALPDGVEITLIRTRAEVITGRLDILLDAGLFGLGLVMALLFLFLNARTALWVAAGIPVAMLGAIFLMYLAGLTINMISLFALIITLGIVVDDAIVVGEHADFRARHLGETPTQAAERAAARMSMPVLAASLTTIIAFFGLVAVGGRFGSLIADIPFTVIVVLTASLVECFLILPNHMRHALAHQARVCWYDLPSRWVTRGFEWVRRMAFMPLMRGVVWLRYPVLAGMLALFATQAAMVLSGEVRWRFFNAPERSSITGNFAMAAGASRPDTLAMMEEMQRATQVVGAQFAANHGRDPIAFVLAQLGGNAGRGLSGTQTKSADQLGAVLIELIDADLRPYSSFDVVRALQQEVKRLPLAETVSFRGGRSGPGGDALDLRLSGAEPARLKAAAEAVKTALSVFPEVSALEDNLAYDKEELSLELSAQGAALGFGIEEISRVLRNRLGGIEAASYPVGPRSAEIRVELPPGELTADFLETTRLRSPGGTYVPLADLVKVSRATGFSTVRRSNGIPQITVSGDLNQDNPTRAAIVMNVLEQEILPDVAERFQIAYALEGLSAQEREFLSDALVGLGLCVVGIYLVLCWVFSSWSRPLVVMMIIPFGLVGTIYGHWLWGIPLSMFTVVGLLGMTGIIINDSIVLVTTIDEYARERPLLPAIVEGTADRLRPVLLTTLTTVLGLAPLLYERSSQAQFLKPTVITLVYGLGFGMLLVLFLVPALIAMQRDVLRLARWLRGLVLPRFGELDALSRAMALLTGLWWWLLLGRRLWNPLPDLWLPPGWSQALALFTLTTAATFIAIWAIARWGLPQKQKHTASPQPTHPKT